MSYPAPGRWPCCVRGQLLAIRRALPVTPFPVLRLPMPHRAVVALDSEPNSGPLRMLGSVGTRGRQGEPPQFMFPRGLQACPWSNSTVLVVDSGNGRVVEVDVDLGVVVKVRSCCKLICECHASSYRDRVSRSPCYPHRTGWLASTTRMPWRRPQH